MDQPTPTFCKEFLKKKGKSVHFSTFVEKSCKKIKKLSFDNLEENDDDNKKTRRKRSKSKKEYSRSKSRKASSKSLKHKNYRIKETKKCKSDKNSNISKDNVNNFIKNHRFELKDDFNEKNVNIFLSSKEAAFEIPIFLNKENIFEY